PAGAQSSSCGPDQEAGRLSRGLLAPRRSAPARQRPGRPRPPVRLRRSSAARSESPLAAPRWTPRLSPEAPLCPWHRGADPRALPDPWAELLLRVFRADVPLCPCGGRRVVLAFITEKKVVKEILEHLGLAATGPPIAPARIPDAGEDTRWQDDVPELQQSLR